MLSYNISMNNNINNLCWRVRYKDPVHVASCCLLLPCVTVTNTPLTALPSNTIMSVSYLRFLTRDIAARRSRQLITKGTYQVVELLQGHTAIAPRSLSTRSRAGTLGISHTEGPWCSIIRGDQGSNRDLAPRWTEERKYTVFLTLATSGLAYICRRSHSESL
jgi:hypothetical protein